MKKNQQTLPGFDKEGHRGCRGLMPENTIPAMLHAINLGVTTLEMDVVITADGKVLVSHDPYFNHEITTKPDGTPVSQLEETSLNIYQMSYSETQKYDVGLKPHPRFPQQKKLKVNKPLLADLVDSVEAYCRKIKKPPVFYNIETKSTPGTDGKYHPEPEPFVDLLMKVVLEKKISRRVIIQSFDYRTLQVLHRKYPSIRIAALVEDFDKRPLEKQLELLGFNPTIYSPEYSLVNEELVKSCHQKNIRIIPWTVNDTNTIRRLLDMGVDGIITDYPNLF